MKVFIVGGKAAYEIMFNKAGWEVTDILEGADLVQYTGGHDVSPNLYGEKRHSKTHSNPIRDSTEQILFNFSLKRGIAQAGICRGAQFLNVMCGGALYQHVEGHDTGSHPVKDLATENVYEASSTHHQMMIPGADATLVATSSQRGVRERVSGEKSLIRLVACKDPEPEVLFYKKFKVLCFQPHPEFVRFEETKDWYFEYLSRYFGFTTKSSS